VTNPHDRTLRLAKAVKIETDRLIELRELHIAIELGDDRASDPIACLAFLTLCNLATRLGPWLPNLVCRAPVDAKVPPSPIYDSGSLNDAALRVLRESIDPEGLSRGSASGEREYDLLLVIGKPTPRARRVLRVSWDGWLARVGPDAEPPSPNENSIGALLAASIATARLHAHLIAHLKRKPHDDEEWSLSAYALDDHTRGPELPLAMRAPPTLMVGAGALGSTTTYLLAHVPRLEHAKLDVVDDDILTKTNSNRQLTAPYARAAAEKVPKIDDLRLAIPAIKGAQLKYDAWKSASGRSAGDYHIAVSAVDSPQVRRDIASDLPRVLINGATGNFGIAIHRVDDPARACLRCEYPIVHHDLVAQVARQLALSRQEVEEIRDGKRSITPEMIVHAVQNGVLDVYQHEADLMIQKGWEYLVRRGCGEGKPDKDLPTASVSYVSATCGFLMAAQIVKETLAANDVPLRRGAECFEWDDLLRSPRHAAIRTLAAEPDCEETHDIFSEIYREKQP